MDSVVDKDFNVNMVVPMVSEVLEIVVDFVDLTVTVLHFMEDPEVLRGFDGPGNCGRFGAPLGYGPPFHAGPGGPGGFGGPAGGQGGFGGSDDLSGGAGGQNGFVDSGINAPANVGTSGGILL